MAAEPCRSTGRTPAIPILVLDYSLVNPATRCCAQRFREPECALRFLGRPNDHTLADFFVLRDRRELRDVKEVIASDILHFVQRQPKDTVRFPYGDPPNYRSPVRSAGDTQVLLDLPPHPKS